MRAYSIEDGGNEIQVALFEDGQQVGGALFPDNEDGDGFLMAMDLGESWAHGNGAGGGWGGVLPI